MYSDVGDVLTVASVKRRDSVLLVRFEGYEDRTAAEALQHTGLWIGVEDRRTLSDDEYWPDELVGCAVRDLDGCEHGWVSDVIEGPAQDRLVVSTPDGEVEIPFVSDLVVRVDLESRLVVIDAIPGLMEPRSTES